jgi:hypothetical protein
VRSIKNELNETVSVAFVAVVDSAADLTIADG